MFEGEKASLEAIQATQTVKVPTPGPVLDHPSGPGTVFIMEHLDLQGLGRHSAALGEQLARYDSLAVCSKKYLEMLQKLQNRAGRIILKINPYCHVSTLYVFMK